MWTRCVPTRCCSLSQLSMPASHTHVNTAAVQLYRNTMPHLRHACAGSLMEGEARQPQGGCRIHLCNGDDAPPLPAYTSQWVMRVTLTGQPLSPKR